MDETLFSINMLLEGYLKIAVESGYLDLNKQELRNAAIQTLSSPPSAPVLGQIYYDSTYNDIGIWTGASWHYYKNAAQLGGYDLSNVLNRANHTGTQTASTISNFNTTVRLNKLNEMASPTASVSLNSQKITSLANGTDNNDAVNVSQLNAAIAAVASGRNYKDEVKVATTGNITLSGTQTIDDVTVVAGDRVLVWLQTNLAQNGIYVVSAGAWTRATDADTWDKIVSASTFTERGTQYGDKQFLITANTGGTLNSTDITIIIMPSLSDLVAGAGISKNGNTISVDYDNSTIGILGGKLAVLTPQLAFANVKITGNGTQENFSINWTGNDYPIVQVFDSSNNIVFTGYEFDTYGKSVVLKFSKPPAEDIEYTVTIIG